MRLLHCVCNDRKVRHYERSRVIKYRSKIEKTANLSTWTIDYDYMTKKTYNDFAEKILFSETKEELNILKQKICDIDLVDWLKADLLELINRKINLL